MTKQKSKPNNADVMDNMPTVQHGVEQAVEISNLTGQGESIKSQINNIALAWFAPFAEAGADADYLKSYSDKTEKNNLKRFTRDYFVEACSIAVVGRSGLAFLQDKNNSGEAELDITEGTLNGQLRSKKYIQSQYGKIISDVAKALRQAAKDAEDGTDTDTNKKKERSDLDRASDGIAKANTQANKKKPDMSISEPLSEAICWLYDNQKALQNGEVSFADMIHAEYFE